jgi:hypothetical protein
MFTSGALQCAALRQRSETGHGPDETRREAFVKNAGTDQDANVTDRSLARAGVSGLFWGFSDGCVC